MTTFRLELKHVGKRYPGVVALDDVSAGFAGGQVHALLGKNGAGKSTLIKILAGSTRPTSGELLLDGKPYTPRSPQDAFTGGIATVHQELSLLPELSVAENIFLGRMPARRTLGVKRLDWKAATANAKKILDELHAAIDPRAKVKSLSVAQQQVVEIAKAMTFAPSVLMLDEPTSALPRHEAEQLFKLVRRLAASGVAVLYITHRLGELRGLADTVTVLRDGRLIAQRSYDASDARGIVQLMFGEEPQRPRPADVVPTNDVLLEARGLSNAGRFEDVSFTLRRGEVLGIAGTLGSGRTSLVRCLFGADTPTAGELRLDGKKITPRSPRQMRDAGIAMIPESRKEHGLVLPHSVRSNFFLASLGKMSRFGVSSPAREKRVAQQLVKDLSVAVSDVKVPVGTLSGGNQQKVVVGKWLNAQPRVILFDEPTRGIDLHAKQLIFEIIWDLARQGLGCIMVSSELEELLEVCQRILILKEGRLAGEVRAEDSGVDDLWMRCISA